MDATREKTGVFIGAYALNPVNGERIPIWIADYVLLGYGTGAIMAVPAHDQRDFEFARQYGLKIAPVIQAEGEELPDPDTMPAATTRKGVMVNSGPLTGTPADKAVRQAIAYLEEQGLGKGAVNYRIRDWLISRQRYWGAPIPMIHCPKDGTVPVPDDQLPVTLPEDIDFRPTGESPLKYHPTWRFTTCPVCGGPAERDTDTMDTFVDSSWYWYRYCSPHDDQAFMDPEKGRYWLPVDQYAGGIEHATMHLLYARFFHKALRDMGLVWGDEPFLRLFNQGLILGPDGEKMSKSRGNVIDPDAEVAKYGADVVRVYLMFLGPWSKGGPWKTEGVEGPMRWLQRVWRLVLEEPSAAAQAGDADLRELRRRRHKAIQKVGEDISRFEFNTAIASLMEYTNFLIEKKATSLAATPDWTEASRTLLLLVAPFAPHLAEELWERLGYAYSIHQQPWPAYDPELAKDEEITLPVQINGKLRDKVTVPADVTEEQVRELVLARDKVRATIDSQQLAKWIYVPGRLVNLVVR